MYWVHRKKTLKFLGVSRSQCPSLSHGCHRLTLQIRTHSLCAGTIIRRLAQKCKLPRCWVLKASHSAAMHSSCLSRGRPAWTEFCKTHYFRALSILHHCSVRLCIWQDWCPFSWKPPSEKAWSPVTEWGRIQPCKSPGFRPHLHPHSSLKNARLCPECFWGNSKREGVKCNTSSYSLPQM